MEILELTKSKVQEEIKINKCYNCESDNLISIKNKELDKKGILCDNCGCFHFYDEDGDFTYEYVYKDIFVEKDVKWKLNDN